jgi:hypothetical protein
MLEYEPSILYIRTPAHRAGAMRNFAELIFYEVG